MTRWFVLASFLLASSPVLAVAQSVKIGYVDLQRAIPETDEGKKAKKKLGDLFALKQKEINEQQDEAKKEAEDLRKKATLLPAEQVRQREAALAEKAQRIQETYMRHQSDLAQKEQEAMAPILDRMTRIINKMAQTENFTVIVEKSALVYAAPSLDLTNELIRRFNAGEGGPASPPGAPTAGGGKTTPAPAKKK